MKFNNLSELAEEMGWTTSTVTGKIGNEILECKAELKSGETVVISETSNKVTVKMESVEYSQHVRHYHLDGSSVEIGHLTLDLNTFDGF